ncbi:RNA polymerase subunit sigma-70 [Streptomyces curacoi]|uniref:RNA polymerase subunit sigma-70 n=1 Tax=Streptomyces curacoi TaxID=146536 RepID=A0A117PII6_9ACTN|nr:RNA polymerase subunit sigma-70 [Streptomyces curacoi]
MPDGLLAVRAAEGDEDSFAVLVQRHSRPLLALARCMLGNAQDAEDAVQDAFVSAWRRLPEYRHGAQFRTWMYRITVNRCLTMRRRRLPPLPLDAVAEPATGDEWSSPARAAEQNAATAALARALGELDAGQRVCWILRELQGLPYKEIAHVTQTSEQTVRGRLFRARRSLKEAMAPWR